MLVKQVMSTQLTTIRDDDPVKYAKTLLRGVRFHHLPVLENTEVVGIITERDLRGPSPFHGSPQPSPLPNWDEQPVRRIMSPPIEVTPTTPIEIAARLMEEQSASALLVIEDTRLVGIITESDIFHVFVRVMGVLEPSTRLQLLLDDRPGALAQVTEIVKDHNVNITSLVTEPATTPGKRVVVLRLNTINPGPVIAALRAAGLRIEERAWQVEEQGKNDEP